MSDTENTQGLNEILFAVYASGIESGQGRTMVSQPEVIHRRKAFIGNNPVSKDAKQAILQWVNDEVITLAEIKSHLDHHFFDDKIPESLTTDKEQRAFGYGYNTRGDEQRRTLKQHGWKGCRDE